MAGTFTKDLTKGRGIIDLYIQDFDFNNDPTPSQLVHLMHNKCIFCIVDPSHS